MLCFSCKGHLLGGCQLSMLRLRDGSSRRGCYSCSPRSLLPTMPRHVLKIWIWATRMHGMTPYAGQARGWTRTCGYCALLKYVPSHSPTKECSDLSTEMSRSDMQTIKSEVPWAMEMSQCAFHGSCCVHTVPEPSLTLDTCIQEVTVQAQVLARDLDPARSIQPVTPEVSVRLVMTSPYQYQSYLDCSRPWNGVRRGSEMRDANLDYVLEF
jgi:hypothetical protein